MVTDIIEKEEPIRNKLRTLGVNILSDIYGNNRDLIVKNIEEILSFLDIASTLDIISKMNSDILKKEFAELKKPLTPPFNIQNNPKWLEEFLNERERTDSIGQKNLSGTRIGVQRGSTLLGAIKNIAREKSLSNRNINLKNNYGEKEFDSLKKERRENVLKIIKDKGGEVSIKDIILGLGAIGHQYGEKTLQRELVSMVSDNILHKIGEKRWSRYFLPK